MLKGVIEKRNKESESKEGEDEEEASAAESDGEEDSEKPISFKDYFLNRLEKSIEKKFNNKVKRENKKIRDPE